jgi:TatA/E family protein of Tat protein translocase
MVGDILQPTHLLFLLIVALVVLGPKRLPEVARTLGEGLRDFRSAISGERDDNPLHDAPDHHIDSESFEQDGDDDSVVSPAPNGAEPVHAPPMPETGEAPRAADPVEAARRAETVQVPRAADPIEASREAETVQAPRIADPVEPTRAADPVDAPREADTTVQAPREADTVQAPRAPDPTQAPRPAEPTPAPRAAGPERLG